MLFRSIYQNRFEPVAHVIMIAKFKFIPIQIPDLNAWIHLFKCYYNIKKKIIDHSDQNIPGKSFQLFILTFNFNHTPLYEHVNYFFVMA